MTGRTVIAALAGAHHHSTTTKDDTTMNTVLPIAHLLGVRSINSARKALGIKPRGAPLPSTSPAPTPQRQQAADVASQARATERQRCEVIAKAGQEFGQQAAAVQYIALGLTAEQARAAMQAAVLDHQCRDRDRFFSASAAPNEPPTAAELAAAVVAAGERARPVPNNPTTSEGPAA